MRARDCWGLPGGAHSDSRGRSRSSGGRSKRSRRPREGRIRWALASEASTQAPTRAPTASPAASSAPAPSPPRPGSPNSSLNTPRPSSRSCVTVCCSPIGARPSSAATSRSHCPRNSAGSPPTAMISAADAGPLAVTR
ncbi:hypothetical protein SALBM135S_08147 [Streptomyces alboniger]